MRAVSACLKSGARTQMPPFYFPLVSLFELEQIFGGDFSRLDRDAQNLRPDFLLDPRMILD